MRFLRRSLVGLFLLSITLALLAVAGQSLWSAIDARMNAEPRAFPSRERVATVNTLTVEPTRIVPELTVFGELLSRRTLAIRTPVGGTLDSLSEDFVEGGAVTAGEILLQIDPAEAEDALARARADLTDAEAEGRDADRALTLAANERAAAEAQAVLRRQALARAQDLQARGIMTATDLEAAELAASAAEAQVLSAEAAIAQAEARIDQAVTAVARARIALAEAQRARDGTAIAAAFDGQLAGVTVSPGARVTANEQVGTLVDPAALEVAFRVSAAQYLRLIGDAGLLMLPVRIVLDVQGLEIEAEGRITREAAVVGEGQTGRLIYAALDAAPGFRPGDFVTVRIEEPPLDAVALLPATALGAGDTVLALDPEGRLELVPVALLRRQGDAVIVSAPDLAGREIVAERSPLLGPGVRVESTAADAALTASAAAPTEPPESDAPSDLIELSDDRRARLLAFVEGNERLPQDARTRIIAQLSEPSVPADLVARLENRMGG